jgi:outer membrane protein TolC
MAEMRSGYVELKILDQQNQLLISIKEVLENNAHTVRERYQEGTLSGLDHNLLQMTFLTIEAAINQLLKHRLDLENRWNADAGIGVDHTVDRQTEIRYVPVPKNMDLTVFADIDSIPGMETRYAQQAALKADLSMEKMRLIPDISIAGGYKEVAPGFKGYQIEFSLPLPFFNLNRPQIEKKRLQLASSETDLLLYRNQVAGQINTHRQLIFDYQTLLEKMSLRLTTEDVNLQQIISAYQEGWLSLTEMLNAVNIYYDFVTSYNQLLVYYYHTVFQLEAISGQKLIVFN